VHCTSPGVLDPGTPLCQAGKSRLGHVVETLREIQNLWALGRKHMAHNHGNEYQIQIVHEDGTEQLSGWTDRAEQVALAMAAVHRQQGKAYWLLVRNVICPNCLDRIQRIVEYPITDTLSPRCSPQDSRYMLAVGLRSRYELLEASHQEVT
jgi:hypothetical protein